MICQISNIIFHVLIPLQNKHGSFLKYVDSGFMCKCVIPTRVFSVGGGLMFFILVVVIASSVL